MREGVQKKRCAAMGAGAQKRAGDLIASRGAGNSALAPKVWMLGIPFDAMPRIQAHAAIRRMLEAGQSHQVVTANSQFLRLSLRSARLRAVLRAADLVLCDSGPLCWAARLLGQKNLERVSGADLVPLLLRSCADSGKTVFWLGGTPADSEAVREKLRREMPELRFHAQSCPGFPPSASSLREAGRAVVEAKPDLLLVSWGCPYAEIWIHRHARKLGVPVAVGVGAAIGFFSGRLRRAPRIVQICGMEWAFRMVQEPRRLVGRYLRDAAVVPKAVLRQWRPDLMGAISQAYAMAPQILRSGRLRIPILAWLGTMGSRLGFKAR
jgi:N-acetylglucosaminyldiphosphoundecaprenol N-acetyl-beta-D-mannosaminyltransferase